MKTRRARVSKKTRRVMRGGRRSCPTKTKDDQQIVNLWKTSCRILYDNFDANYRCEWHLIESFGTCNMWVWKDSETSQAQDQHLDVYWEDWNRAILGVKGTFTEREKRGKKWVEIAKYTSGYKTCDLSDYLNSSQEEMGYAIAECVDNAYNEFFY